MENCDILQLVGLPCGNAEPNKDIRAPIEQAPKGLGTGGAAGIVVFVVIFLNAVLVGAIFYYRRKYKVAKVNSPKASFNKLQARLFAVIYYVYVQLLNCGILSNFVSLPRINYAKVIFDYKVEFIVLLSSKRKDTIS